ncbi:site-specific DNA-methyltransferase [Paenarthrobacter sp. Z7-10]|uniref:site-specific DNA-methyltransferase n=1 Tax=Paenarthrobacter sp. Z7-10 TaxID=2787635 RepID=UPI0022A9DCBD|nr:site-specific DNA-methyltransferase [Paenarthrobacter sp. Z7-10]MCZ2404460.1 site-specific DNA-methyltransferase [Paenarthrobacter sp. Z7-10]
MVLNHTNGANERRCSPAPQVEPTEANIHYIDPPYNTGNKTWQYNDHYVAEQDSFRHSKWLSLMERRLMLAKKLLKPTGVIIVAIGDEEHHRLRILMDEIFGDQNFLANLVWDGGTKSYASYVSSGQDYMLVYSKSAAALTQQGIQWRETKPEFAVVIDTAARLFRSSDGDADLAGVQFRDWLKKADLSPGIKRFNQIEAVTGRVFNADRDLGAPEKRPNRSFKPLLHPATGRECPVPSNGWRLSETELLARLSAGRIAFGETESKIPREKSYLDEASTQIPGAVFQRDRSAASIYLNQVLGDKRFPFPKDHNVLMRWIRLTAPKDAVILDFFGGSGTTAEAVIRLNAEDKGTRQCILVTNNELSAKDDAALRKAGHQPGSAEYEAQGVFHNVTKPRIETVVTGVRQDGSVYSDGLPANVEFLDLAYLEESRVHAALEYERLAPLFWLKSGAVGTVVQRTEDSAYEWNEESSMAVLFNAGKAAELAEVLATKPNQVEHVFIITDSPEQGDLAGEAFSDELTVEPIYGSYLDAFQINRSDS